MIQSMKRFMNHLKLSVANLEIQSDWGHIIYIDCSVFGEIQLYWDEQGVRYLIKQEDDYDEYLKKVLDYEMQGLQERYGSDAVNFENVVGKLPDCISNILIDHLIGSIPRLQAKSRNLQNQCMKMPGDCAGELKKG